MFRAMFDFIDSADSLPAFWPDDVDNQAHWIRCFSLIATTPEMPDWWREQAFDSLEAIAHHYRESGIPCSSLPQEMNEWCFSVVSGAVERPKPRRGRHGAYGLRQQRRNQLVAIFVTMLTLQGKTVTKAMKLVADAACLSVERVDSILSEVSADRAKGKYVPESVMRELSDRENE